jgi:hypothetical protein
MIEQLKRITHVLGHIVQPAEVKEVGSQPDLKLLGIGVDGDLIHINAVTASAEALVASVRQVLADEYEIEETEQQIEGCVTLIATAKPKQSNTGDADDAATD